MSLSISDLRLAFFGTTDEELAALTEAIENGFTFSTLITTAQLFPITLESRTAIEASNDTATLKAGVIELLDELEAINA